MPGKTYHIITFGCQMNVHESQWLAGVLTKRGFAQAPAESAGVILLNTCSVREKPEQKVLSTLGRIRQITGGSSDVLVGVLGCVAQQLGDALFEKSSQVRLIIGTDGLAGAPQAIEDLLLNPRQRLSLLDFTRHYVEREDGETSSPMPSAHVTIMQGCDNFCTYCIVPFTRGRQKSRTTKAILGECRMVLDRGAREITLLGQNVNAFGQDKSGDGTTFSQLLGRVASLPGLARLRYVTPHPKDMGEDDIRDFARLPQLCPRLHLPLQSGSDQILSRMRRGYTRAEFLTLVNRLRKARPDLALSTDLIVGFPGESEEDFELTLDTMRECAFMSSFSFCYSDRPGARAALYPEKIPSPVAQERLLRLQSLQEDLASRWLQGRVGQKTRLLIECPSPKQECAPSTSWQGRDPYGTPVHVPLPSPKDHTGCMVDATITLAKKHSLMAVCPGTP